MPKTTEPKPMATVAAEVAAKTEITRPDPPDQEKLVEKQQANAYTEAPASANVYVISHDGFNWQITVRSQAAIEEVHHLLELMAYIETMSLAGGFRPKSIGDQGVSRDTLSQSPTAPPLPAASLPTPTGAVQLPPEPEYVPVPGTTPEMASQTPLVNTFHCVLIEITPRADGKTSVKFYGNSHKTPVDEYPTVTFTGTPEKAVQLLAPVWTIAEAQFERAVKYTVAWEVDWVFSQRKTAEGKPYKDVAAVRRAQ